MPHLKPIADKGTKTADVTMPPDQQLLSNVKAARRRLGRLHIDVRRLVRANVLRYITRVSYSVRVSVRNTRLEDPL